MACNNPLFEVGEDLNSPSIFSFKRQRKNVGLVTLSAMRERVTVVSLSVCLCPSDFEDNGVFTFETGINVNY